MDGYVVISGDRAAKLNHLRGELYGWGNVSLLSEVAVGICGSRKASEHGLAYAFELGQLAAQYGLVVVSGHAAGVDQHAHQGAIQAGGQTIAVLPEGIGRFRPRRALRDVLTGGNFLAVSEFQPEAPWTAWRAMQRNATMIELADAMFVVEAGETGGTIDAGKETLRAGKPLFVLEFLHERPQTRGNHLLLERGATPVANMKELKRALEQVKDRQLVSHRLF